MERVRQAFSGDEMPEGDVGYAAVDKARREIRAALIAKLEASPSTDELQRLAEILKRAADEIRRK